METLRAFLWTSSQSVYWTSMSHPHIQHWSDPYMTSFIQYWTIMAGLLVEVWVLDSVALSVTFDAVSRQRRTLQRTAHWRRRWWTGWWRLPSNSTCGKRSGSWMMWSRTGGWKLTVRRPTPPRKTWRRLSQCQENPLPRGRTSYIRGR